MLESPNGAGEETGCSPLADDCICGADRRNHVVVAWCQGTMQRSFEQEGDRREQKRGIRI